MSQTPAPITIETLTASDLPTCLALREQAGWNQKRADVSRIIALAGKGAILAKYQGQPAGVVMAIPFGSVAWVCMMLVEERLRGKGIGRILMQHALDWCENRGIATVRLDATPLGRPMYEKFGFRSQYLLTRFAGVPNLLEQSGGPAPRDGRADEALFALDARVTKTDRRTFLAALCSEPETSVRVVPSQDAANESEQISGYSIVRPGENATFIGPIIGTNRSAACALVEDAFRSSGGRPVYIDVPQAHSAATQLATAAGLSPQRELTRMTRGQELCEDLPHLWASSGPEKG